MVDGAERYLALRDRDDAARFGFDASAFAGLSEEVRLRLLMRAIDRVGHEGSAELGKAEALLAALDRAAAAGEGRLKQTLAGAVISLAGGRIHVEPAPPRRTGKR
jgi:tRNA(Ile)-lysidine synthase